MRFAYGEMKRERTIKRYFAIFLVLIMVFSVMFSTFSFLNNYTTNTSNSSKNITPKVYTRNGETVCFIGNQPVISFGRQKYPVSYNVFTINKASGKTVNPLVTNSSGGVSVSLVNFNSSKTSLISTSNQSSAELLQSSNSTSAASVFFFDKYGISSALSFENRMNQTKVYAIDFTMVLPYSKSYQLLTPNLQMKKNINGNASSIAGPACGINIDNVTVDWACESSLFRAGEIKVLDGFDVLILPFGPIKLNPMETYTVDPSIQPDIIGSGGGIIKSGGGGGGGGGSTSVTTYPPSFSSYNIVQPSSSCFANGSTSSHVKMCFDISSQTSNGPVKEGYFEVENNGNVILLGTVNAYQNTEYTFSTNVNNIGCFKGFELAYENPGSSTWTCEKLLGHSFNEFINFTHGYVFPDLQEFPDQGRVIDSNTGKVVASVSGGLTSYAGPSLAHIGDTREVCLYQDFLSKGDTMAAIQRSYCFAYSSNSKGIAGQSFGFTNIEESCVTTTCDYTPLEFTAMAIATAIIGFVITGMTGIGLIVAGITIVIALSTYNANPDHPVITNNVNSDGKLTCCDKATKSAPNEPYNYFQYGCCVQSNVFGTRFYLCTGTSDYCGNVVEHYNYGENFELFNTTLTGNLCQEEQTYSGTLSSPVYIYFG